MAATPSAAQQAPGFNDQEFDRAMQRLETDLRAFAEPQIDEAQQAGWRDRRLPRLDWMQPLTSLLDADIRFYRLRDMHNAGELTHAEFTGHCNTLWDEALELDRTSRD